MPPAVEAGGVAIDRWVILTGIAAAEQPRAPDRCRPTVRASLGSAALAQWR